MTSDTRDIAMAGDKLMHAAQHLAGVSKYDYSNPAVWGSIDPAIMILRKRYKFIFNALVEDTQHG